MGVDQSAHRQPGNARHGVEEGPGPPLGRAGVDGGDAVTGDQEPGVVDHPAAVGLDIGEDAVGHFLQPARHGDIGTGADAHRLTASLARGIWTYRRFLTRGTERVRASRTGGSSRPSTTRLRTVPMPSTASSTTSPGRSGGGSFFPLRPHSSARQPPLPQVPEPSTSPARTWAPREAYAISSSNGHPILDSRSWPVCTPLTDARRSSARNPSLSR